GCAAVNRITGGGGKDTIATGGGNDVIAYLATTESFGTKADLIKDFAGAGLAGGDRIDLSAIDATAGGINNAFVFGGTTATAHGVWYAKDSAAGLTHVYVDTDGVTSTAEMTINLTGLMTMNAGDFVL
ncbi:MAG: metalloprotease, Hemolysin-type calcium-binding region, partial [Pseudomonadota bacterium]